MSEPEHLAPKLRPWLEQSQMVATRPSRAACAQVAAGLSRALVEAGFNTVLDGERVRFSRGLASWVRARSMAIIDGGELRVSRADGKLSVSYRIAFLHYLLMGLAMALSIGIVLADRANGRWVPFALVPLSLVAANGLVSRFAFRRLLRSEIERP